MVKAAGKKQPVPLTKWIEVHDKAALASKASKAAKKAGLAEPPAFIPASKRPPKPRKPKQVKPEPGRYSQASEDLNKMDQPVDGLDVNANRQRLGATREGEEINQAVTNWSNSFNTDPFREGADLWMQGGRAGIDASGALNPAYKSGAELMEAVITAPQTKQVMHRGIRVPLGRIPTATRDEVIQLKKIAKTKKIGELEEQYKRGSTFDNSISSYSRTPEKAAQFAGRGQDPDAVSVIFNVQPGARGLNIEPISSYIGEAETVIAGRYEVLGTQRIQQVLGETLHVEVRQIESFVRAVK